METHCLRHTEIPGTSRLFLDYAYHFDRLSEFYSYNPYDPDSYAQAASRIEYPAERRAALVSALERSQGDSASLRKLAQPGTVAVVTGQQAGLFSGPAYTIYKALTAARLAQDLSEKGIAAVPVFWIATEDHDFAEVDHSHVFDASHRAVMLKAAGSGVAGQPVGTIPLPAPPVAGLAAALEGFSHGEEIAALARAAYPDGVTLGEGFRNLIRSLLDRFGLLYIDPLDPAIRRISAPFLAQALEHSAGLNPKLRKRSAELEQRGYHAQVLVEEDATLLFRLEGERRLALRRRNGGYSSHSGRAYTEAELLAEPEKLSPNALLRPVMQDYLLPTVAYVGGAAEVAYLAQSQAIYGELLDRMPVILPRSGFTLMGQREQGQMQRYSMPLPAFFGSTDTVYARMASRLIPSSVATRYEEARKSQERTLDGLRQETLALDPTLGKALDRAKAKIEFQLQKMERKTAAAALRQDSQARRHAESLSALLYPNKHLQERYYSILPFLAQYGRGLLEELYANVHLDCPDHKIAMI